MSILNLCWYEHPFRRYTLDPICLMSIRSRHLFSFYAGICSILNFVMKPNVFVDLCETVP